MPMSIRRMRRGGLVPSALAAAFAMCCVAGCSSGSAAPAGVRSAGRPRALVILQPARAQTSLPGGFIGLSLEASSLSRDEFAHTNLAAYLRTLGRTGVLRIGGNSLDETFWTSTGERPPAWSIGTITPASLFALATAIAGTGWRVILGVNLKHGDPGRAANEARIANRILGPTLEAIEIGNEPDYYHVKESAYFTDFARYVRAIRTAVPGVGIAGPEAARDDPRWVSRFARHEAIHPDISVLTTHNYPLSVCGGQRPTIADLLSVSSVRSEEAAANSAVAAARIDRVPAMIDETNSVVCWGAKGVSNVYASALWTLDYALLLAQHGVAGASFHGKISGCNPYSPLCTTNGSRLTAQPEFYGLLALGQVGPGRFLDVANSAPASLRAYAVQTAPGHVSIVLDNLGPDMTVTLRWPYIRGAYGRQTVLATRSPLGLAATAGISLGGKQIGDDGVFPHPTYTHVTIAPTTATLRVGAHAAVILKVG